MGHYGKHPELKLVSNNRYIVGFLTHSTISPVFLIAYLYIYIYKAACEHEVTKAEATGVPIQFAYVPSHLHHMCFEIFKNSMRATVEQFKDGEMLEVLVSKTDADITIRLL